MPNQVSLSVYQKIILVVLNFYFLRSVGFFDQSIVLKRFFKIVSNTLFHLLHARTLNYSLIVCIYICVLINCIEDKRSLNLRGSELLFKYSTYNVLVISSILSMPFLLENRSCQEIHSCRPLVHIFILYALEFNNQFNVFVYILCTVQNQ